MKKEILLISITILIGVVFFSCKKENVKSPISDTILNSEVDTCTCVNLPNKDYTYLYSSNLISSPLFNPNNDNEILFINSSNGVKNLVKYNLLTKNKTVIFEGQIFGIPTWSKNNWIVFARGYTGLCRIRPDGTNLSVIVSDGNQFHPKFNQSGNKLLTYHAFTHQGQYPAKIWNIDGKLLDSMNYHVNLNSAWNNQSNIAFRKDDKIFIVNPETKEILATHETFLGEGYPNYSHGFSWINENEAILEHGFDVKKLNVWTGELTHLFCGCNSRKYLDPTMNESGTKAISNKIIYQETDDPFTLQVISTISIYDFENDTLIDLLID